MLMDIIVIIILFGIGYVIVDTITAIKNARHKSNLPEVAKNASETKKIISCLKSASTAKVDRVECRLSINSAEYPGVIEVIQVDMKLTCPELVPRYAALKEEYRQAVRSQVTAEVNGDHLYASQMNKKQNELRQELKKYFFLVSFLNLMHKPLLAHSPTWKTLRSILQITLLLHLNGFLSRNFVISQKIQSNLQPLHFRRRRRSR